MEFNNSTVQFKKEIEQIIKLFRNIESILQMTIILSKKIKIIKIKDKIKNSNEIDENINTIKITILPKFFKILKY